MKTYILKYKIKATKENMENLDFYIRDSVFPYQDIERIEDYEKTFVEYERCIQGFSMSDIKAYVIQEEYEEITNEQADKLMDILEKNFDASIGMSWDTISIWMNQYESDLELKKIKKIKIKYLNIDSFNRPIFKAIDSPFYYGSTDVLFPYEENEAEVRRKILVDDLCYFGNHFDCEPMGTPVIPGILEIIWSDSNEKV